MMRFIVQVDAYQGEHSGIELYADDNDSLRTMYCVGQLDDDGIVDLIDCGYASIGELLEAWPRSVLNEKD